MIQIFALYEVLRCYDGFKSRLCMSFIFSLLVETCPAVARCFLFFSSYGFLGYDLLVYGLCILFGESYIRVSADVPEWRKSYFDSGLWWTSGTCLGICIPFYLYTSQRIWSVFNMVTRLGSGQFTGCVTFIWCHGHMALNMSFLSRVSVTGVIVYPYIRLLYSWIGNLIWVWTA
jgi:hypothetical protein